MGHATLSLNCCCPLRYKQQLLPLKIWFGVMLKKEYRYSSSKFVNYIIIYPASYHSNPVWLSYVEHKRRHFEEYPGHTFQYNCKWGLGLSTSIMVKNHHTSIIIEVHTSLAVFPSLLKSYDHFQWGTGLWVNPSKMPSHESHDPVDFYWKHKCQTIVNLMHLKWFGY